MVRGDSVQVQPQGLFKTCGNPVRPAVQDVRWQVGEIPVTAKQITAEQQAAGFAVKPAVAVGVTGQMNDFESAPDRNRSAVLKPAVDAEP